MLKSVDVKIGSFFGTKYNRDYSEDKKSQFFSKHLFRLGATVSPAKDIEITTSASLHDNVFGTSVSFHEFTVMYRKELWQIGYRYFMLGFGEGSRIFDTNVLDTYYDEPVLEQYDFYGVDGMYRIGDAYLGARVGGNEYNTSILELTSGYEHRYGNFGVWLLHVERDNLYNSRMSSVGGDFTADIEQLHLYGAIMYRHYPKMDKVDDTSVTSWIAEAGYTFDHDLSIAANYVAKQVNQDEPTWQFNVRSAWRMGIFEPAFLWKYYKRMDYTEKEYRGTAMFELTPGWKMGFNAAAIDPSIGSMIYQIGVETLVDMAL